MFGLILIILLIIIPVFLFVWLMKSGKENLKVAIKVFVLGMLGWLVALFLRLPIIQGIQVTILLRLGVDLTDTNAVQAYAQYLPLIIWGPILAGIFEGGFRYVFVKIPREVRTERRYLPGLFGLGWTFCEILILVIVPIASSEYLFTLPLFNALLSFIERISASLLHIALSYVAFYGIFEESGKKYSVYLAILLHMFFDGLIILWSSAFNSLNPELYYISLESTLFVGGIAVFLWTFKLWIPRSERLIESRKAILEQQGILGEGVVQPPATKDDISIEKT